MAFYISLLRRQAFSVTVHIKLRSYPNSINLDPTGVIPVAILSTTTFNATIIDPDSLRLAGASVGKTGSCFVTRRTYMVTDWSILSGSRDLSVIPPTG
jgi:hypothetical protein